MMTIAPPLALLAQIRGIKECFLLLKEKNRMEFSSAFRAIWAAGSESTSAQERGAQELPSSAGGGFVVKDDVTQPIPMVIFCSRLAII